MLSLSFCLFVYEWRMNRKRSVQNKECCELKTSFPRAFCCGLMAPCISSFLMLTTILRKCKMLPGVEQGISPQMIPMHASGEGQSSEERDYTLPTEFRKLQREKISLCIYAGRNQSKSIVLMKVDLTCLTCKLPNFGWYQLTPLSN